MTREQIVTRRETTIERTVEETIVYREISDDPVGAPQLPVQAVNAIEKRTDGVLEKLERCLKQVKVILGLGITVLTAILGFLQYVYNIFW